MFTLLALSPPTRGKRKVARKGKKHARKGSRSSNMARRRRRRNPRGKYKRSAAQLKKLRAALVKARAARGSGKKRGRKAGRKASRRGARKGARRVKVANRRWKIRKGKAAYLPYLSRKTKRFSPLVKRRLVLLGAAREAGGQVVLNPRRKRRGKRRNPVHARRGRRHRRNPISIRGGIGQAKSTIKSVFSVRTVKVGASAAAGMVLARLAPALIARIPVVGGLTNMLGRFRDPILAAIGIAVGAQLVRKFKLPVENTALVAGGLGVAALDGAKVLGLTRYIPGAGGGSGVSGLSDIVTPSQLVNQEAIYGGMGDYLTLSGPVPEQYFAGGLNDYVDFTSPAAGAAAQAASFAQTTWTPGAEGFTAGGN